MVRKLTGNCYVCNQVKATVFHHVSYYFPNVLMPVCESCHQRIHYGDYFLLCPLHCKEFCWEDNSIYGSNIDIQAKTMPSHLQKYVRIAYESKITSRKEVCKLREW